MNRALGIAAPLIALALGACGQATPDAPAEPARDTTAAAPVASASASPAPAHLQLAAVEPADVAIIADSMDNVGGCDFIADDRRTLLSVGLPDSGTAKGFGVARAGGVVVQAQTEESGRAAIEAGPELAFEGIVLDVAHRGGAGETVGTETSAWSGTLTVRDSDGKSRAYPGRWACGV